MSIKVSSPKARELPDLIRKEIEAAKRRSKEKSVIKTWRWEPKGYFVHTDDQWDEKIGLKPRLQLQDTVIVFEVVELTASPASLQTLGHYQGEFAGMLITHFSNIVQYAAISPEPKRPQPLKKTESTTRAGPLILQLTKLKPRK